MTANARITKAIEDLQPGDVFHLPEYPDDLRRVRDVCLLPGDDEITPTVAVTFTYVDDENTNAAVIQDKNRPTDRMRIVGNMTFYDPGTVVEVRSSPPAS
jgi:hypothetical protein